MNKYLLCLAFILSTAGLVSCFQSIDAFQAKSIHLQHGGGGGHGRMGGHGGGMGGHGGGMGGHGGGMGGHGGGMGGHGGHMGSHGGAMGGQGGGTGGHGGVGGHGAMSGHAIGMGGGGHGSTRPVGGRMMGKDAGLGDFTEQDAYRARDSARHSADHSADDAIAINSRMDPSSEEDIQFLDTKNGRMFGKDSDIKQFLREEENLRQTSSRGSSLKMSPVRSEQDKCDLLVTNSTAFASNHSCTCEHVAKSICVFGKSEPRPTPGSKVMYEGCYKANMPGIIDPDYICQAVRYCEEKKCDAIYHDGSQFVYIKCYYGSLPVKKNSNSKAHIFTLSKSC